MKVCWFWQMLEIGANLRQNKELASFTCTFKLKQRIANKSEL